MDDEARASEARFVEYIESLAQVLGYVDRAGPLRDNCTGLMMPGERTGVGPLAWDACQARATDGRCVRRLSARRFLWVRWRISRRRHRDGADLCGGRSVAHQRLAS